MRKKKLDDIKKWENIKGRLGCRREIRKRDR